MKHLDSSRFIPALNPDYLKFAFKPNVIKCTYSLARKYREAEARAFRARRRPVL
jgi:hypothetical protein